MEITFMTIHNLTPQANILYASESIVDILGFQPGEVVGRSCFDYFHPEEIPNARKIHNRGVQMDKAASLHYARIQNREGQWVGCECVFTIVYEVLVACTSIYRGDANNDRRAIEAPKIRRRFASSPRDPRYHMLEHLSAKFRAPSQDSLLEPRAALILNRFTRTLTVMYATNAVSKILGITPEELQDTGFYECIQRSCLDEAIDCLERAKANDSIAYLRFWYRDPRGADDLEEDDLDETSGSSDSEDGGVELSSRMDLDSPQAVDEVYSPPTDIDTSGDDKGGPSNEPRILHNGRTSSGESTDLEQDSAQAIFDRAAELSRPSTPESSVLLLSPASRQRRIQPPRIAPERLEIEAVISCTSDGLVVVLRRARPEIPSLLEHSTVPQRRHGLFAAPWGANPIRPYLHYLNPQYPFQHGLLAPLLPAGGPPLDEFMNSIREVAVFAWSLTGINGNIASYGHGTPRGEAVPLSGLPVWDPYGQPSPGYLPPENQAAQRWARLGEKTNEPNSLVPYQHPQQEANLRAQNGYGHNELMGSDRQASMGQGSRNGRLAFAYSSNIQAQHLGLVPQGQGGWQTTILANAGHYVSNSQHQGSQGPSGGVVGGNRYL